MPKIAELLIHKGKSNRLSSIVRDYITFIVSLFLYCLFHKFYYFFSESLATFLIGEGKLELYLEEFPPIDANINKARSGLAEAKRFLVNSTTEQGKKAGVLLDAHLLLGKVHYAMALYEDSLNNYNQAELQTLTEKHLPCRSLRIVAESYAIKGISPSSEM